VPLLASLLKTILLPLAVGVLLRSYVPGVAETIDANKKLATKAQSCLLIVVPWMQVSNSVSAFAELR
jgi:sodium/bile acid cotransporter 7